MQIQEGRIKITVPNDCTAMHFDRDGIDGQGHGLSHCMKAVDFIIETPRAINFIELKDPDTGRPQDQSKWLEKWNKKAIEADLKLKFRDTWLYMHASKKINKPINYLVIVEFSQLSMESLQRFTDSLKSSLPVAGPRGAWPNEIVRSCQIFNLATWNKAFQETFPAEIVAPGTGP